jgi:hypothetical protein
MPRWADRQVPVPRSVGLTFTETVNRTASHLLKSLGAERPEIRPNVNRAFARFFNSFAKSEPQTMTSNPVEALERNLTECREMIARLRRELCTWSQVNPDIA